jgi:hypothetical protein
MLAKQALYCLSHTSNPFYSGYFGDGVLPRLVYLPRLVLLAQAGLKPLSVLPILASQIDRIMGMSNQCPATPSFLVEMESC